MPGDAPPLRFGHIGLYTRNLAAMEAFYTGVLGYQATDRGSFRGRALVFLSRDPAEHHQVLLAEGRDDPEGSQVVNQISLRTETLADLREMLARLLAAGVEDGRIARIDHGNAWSLYFPDPDGNRLEVYLPSPWYAPQPAAEPLDLSQSDAEIAATTRARFGDQPGFRPAEEWQRDFAAAFAARQG